MVVEADESDGTFVKLPATIAVITNIDPEHLDHYGTVEALHQGFESFAGNVPFYGLDILCIDHPVVQGLIPRLSERRIVTYGFSPQADIRAVDVQIGRDGARYDVVIADRRNNSTRTISGLTLPMFGRHNVQNSLAVVAVARELKLDDDVLREALAGLQGREAALHQGRRGARHHHHRRLRASSGRDRGGAERRARCHRRAASSRWCSRIAIRGSHNLFSEFCTCFNDADAVIVADVYPAGEAPIEGASRDALVEGLRARGHRNVLPLASPAALAATIDSIAKPGDLVVCLGAGSITNWAANLPAEIDQLAAGARP